MLGNALEIKVLIFVLNNAWLLSLEQAPFCSIFYTTHRELCIDDDKVEYFLAKTC